MNFKTIDEQGRKIISDALSATEYNGCEYQYSYQCAWVSREPKCLVYAYEEDIVYIYFKCTHMPIKRGEMLFLPPIAPLNKMEYAYAKLCNYAVGLGEKARIIAAPKEHVDLLDGSVYSFEKLENADEYLYSTTDLIELPGKKYHAKRNHIAKFERSYNYTFREYQDGDKSGIFALYSAWQQERAEYESREEYALNNMLEKREIYGIKIGVIEIEGKIVAFSFNEVTSNNRGIVHFEKADTAYGGSYAAINNFCAKAFLSQTKIINRQEDLGIEGLRKAKLSYYPIGYCEKWLITKNS